LSQQDSDIGLPISYSDKPMVVSMLDLVAALGGAVLGALAVMSWLLPKLRIAQSATALSESQHAAAEASMTEIKGQLLESQKERARLASVEKMLAGETARREAIEGQHGQIAVQLEQARTEASTAGREVATARETIRALNDQLAQSTARVNQLQETVELAKADRDQAVLASANASKDLENATALHEQTKQFLDAAGEQLRVQFQAVSAQVLDQRGRALGEQHVERLGAIVTPLSQHLKVLEEKIVSVENARAEDRGSMVSMITNLAASSTQLQTEANNLARTLRGNVKARGSWGETILDKVLESSGLVEGRNYTKQESNRDEDDGRLQRPDVVVELPDDRSIVIDSKVSLTAYDRYVNADDEQAAAQALVDHITAIRTRIKELSDKNYAKAFGPGGLDFVLMFVPIEGALALAVQERPELQAEALNKKVALVSPMTLHIALRTVEYLWRMDTLSHSMEQIINKGRLVYEEASRMGEALLDLDKKLNASVGAFTNLQTRLMDPSRGIVRRAQELHKLGVANKSKKTMPEQLALAVDAGDHLTDADTLSVEESEELVGATTAGVVEGAAFVNGGVA